MAILPSLQLLLHADLARISQNLQYENLRAMIVTHPNPKLKQNILLAIFGVCMSILAMFDAQYDCSKLKTQTLRSSFHFLLQLFPYISLLYK